MITVVVEDTTVYEQRTDERIVHRCATRRVAQVLAARLELEAAGWATIEISSADSPRLPLLLPGEQMRTPLDGTRSDDRAQGFLAARGDDRLVVDACAGMPVRITRERGNTDRARQIVEWHLGAIA